MNRKQNSQVAVVTFFPLEKCVEMDREMVTRFRRVCSMEAYDYDGRNLVRSWYLSSLAHGREPLVSNPYAFGAELGYTVEGEAHSKLRIMFGGIRGHFRGRFDPRNGRLTSIFVNHEDMTDEHETNLYTALFNRHRLRQKSEQTKTREQTAAEGIQWQKTQDVEATHAYYRHEERYQEHLNRIREIGAKGVPLLEVRETQCRTVMTDDVRGVYLCGMPVAEGSRHRFCEACSKVFLVQPAKPEKRTKRGFRLQKLSAA